MNSVAFATATKADSPWVLPPSDRVAYLLQLNQARAARRWSLAYCISDVLSAATGHDYIAALEQLKATRARGT